MAAGGTESEETTMQVAKVYASAVEIMCPEGDGGKCDRTDPIPAPDGSFMWTHWPETIRCPDCGRTYKVSRKILAPDGAAFAS